MALCKCRLCGKPFNSLGGNLCADCTRETDNAYVAARKYIYRNPDKANFAAVMEAAEVSEEMLNYLIDEGRITIEGTSGKSARCIACGKETGGGSLCAQCREKLIAEKLMPGLSQADKAGRKSEIKSTHPLLGGKKY